MKLTIERDALFAALTRTAGIVSRRSAIQILQHVRIEAADDAARLTVTNLDIQATISVPARIETPGSTTIAADRLREICSRLPEGAEIAIAATDPLRASIKAGRSRFSVGALPAADFPTLGMQDGGSVLEMEAAAMLRLLTIGACSMGPADPLACCAIEREGDKVRAVSTDRHRLVVCEASASRAFKPKGDTRLSVETVAVLTRALGGMAPAEPATLTILPGKMIAAELGGMSVIGRVLDGEYVPYRRITDFTHQYALTVDTDALIAMLNRARIASDSLFLDLSPGSIEITARDVATGDSSEDQGECDWEGPERRLAISAPNLLGLLEHVKTESTALRVGDPMTPIRVGETGASDWTGWVMPVVGSK